MSTNIIYKEMILRENLFQCLPRNLVLFYTSGSIVFRESYIMKLPPFAENQLMSPELFSIFLGHGLI